MTVEGETPTISQRGERWYPVTELPEPEPEGSASVEEAKRSVSSGAQADTRGPKISGRRQPLRRETLASEEEICNQIVLRGICLYKNSRDEAGPCSKGSSELTEQCQRRSQNVDVQEHIQMYHVPRSQRLTCFGDDFGICHERDQGRRSAGWLASGHKRNAHSMNERRNELSRNGHPNLVPKGEGRRPRFVGKTASAASTGQNLSRFRETTGDSLLLPFGPR